MPPLTPRKVLASTFNPGRKPGQHTNSSQKAGIVAARLEGKTWPEIAARYEVSVSTCQYTVKQYKQRGNLTPVPRGRPPKLLSRRESRALFRSVRANPGTPFPTLREQCFDTYGKRPCRNTLKKHLGDLGLKHWKSLNRILLQRRTVRERLLYAQEWRGREQELVTNVGKSQSIFKVF